MYKFIIPLMLLPLSGAVSAHEVVHTHSAFGTGFMHPIFGLDHVLAMVAVGLWGVFLSKPATWMLPVLFPLMMAVGATIGIMGIALPQVETGIALSSVILGLMIAFKQRPPLPIAYLVVGFFALCHGNAHGTHLPSTMVPLNFSLGFVTSTGLLHLLGVGVALVAQKYSKLIAIQALGAAISLAGVGFVINLV
ncbi:HupE/UreJ family protein [Vibrio sp. E150_011]